MEKRGRNLSTSLIFQNNTVKNYRIDQLETHESMFDKSDILDMVDERQIFQSYFPEKIDLRRNKYKNPFRNDRHKGSCHFNYLRNGRLYFFDKATGDRLDVFSFIMRLYNCSFREALLKVDADFGLGLAGPSYEKRKFIPIPPAREFKMPDIVYKVVTRPWNEVDKKYWHDQYKISARTLNFYKVHPCQTVHACYDGLTYKPLYFNDPKNPCYCYQVIYNGKTYLKIYRPLGHTEDKWRTSSMPIDLKLQGLEQLPEKGKTLYITSSLKDGMCLYESGLTFCAMMHSEHDLAIPNWNDLEQRFEEIIFFLDSDGPGIDAMQKASKMYKTKYIIIPAEFEAKDIADLSKKTNLLKCNQEEVNRLLRAWIV